MVKKFLKKSGTTTHTVYRIDLLTRLLNKWPGKATFGMYRFLPIFFCLGAAVEFSMINWTAGQTNFYKTFKQHRAQDLLERDALIEDLIRAQTPTQESTPK